MIPARPSTSDRRRAQRFDLAGGGQAVLPVKRSVRVVDISLAGVLLESTHPTREGTEGRLRLDLGQRPFAADIQVCRVTPPAYREDAYRIGARFLGLSQEDAQTIARFTRRLRRVEERA